MLPRNSSDLLSYLVDTGPLTVDELATRTSTPLSEFARELKALIDSGDIEVEGNQTALQAVLAGYEEPANDTERDFGPHNVRRDFFQALAAQDAADAKLRLSFKAFRRAQSLAR